MPDFNTNISYDPAAALERVSQMDWSVAAEEDPALISPKRSKRLPDPELNVVPLVDVLFLLMIFFVIAGTFGLSEGVLASRMTLGGRGGWGTPLPISPVVVEVLADQSPGVVYRLRLGQRDRDLHQPAELAAELKRVNELPGFGAQTPVVILADDNALWNDVVEGWNAILLSGFQDVAFGNPTNHSRQAGQG